MGGVRAPRLSGWDRNCELALPRMRWGPQGGMLWPLPAGAEGKSTPCSNPFDSHYFLGMDHPTGNDSQCKDGGPLKGPEKGPPILRTVPTDLLGRARTALTSVFLKTMLTL